MASRSLEDRLTALLEPLAGENGLELVAIEVAGSGPSRVVRVFLDRAGGIDLDTLADANAWISEALDVVETLAAPYTLEVSSPGIERPLRRLADFERFCGESAKVKTTRPVSGRSSFTGTIESVEDDSVVLDVDGTEYRLPIDAIAKARLKVDVDMDLKGAR